jgi:branched-chain amino acid transport system ATP-binding protein
MGLRSIYNHVILVLKGVSLAVPEGGIVALLGANGAGKTHDAEGDLQPAARRARRGDQGRDHLRGERVDALNPRTW